MPTRRQRLAAELKPILACGDAARALATGSGALLARGRAWALEEGHRGRLGGLALGAAVTGKAVEMWPATSAAIATAWTIAAWMHAPPPGKPEVEPLGEDADTPPEPTPADPRTTLLTWLDELTQGRAGIHLHELHEHITARPTTAHLSKADVRALLDRHQIPVQRTLRVGPVAGRSGVSRTAILALLPDPAQDQPETHSPPPESGPELRKSTPLSARGEELESSPPPPHPALEDA
ncbi:hypothetical protein [Streptomyces sp. WMMC897]|uniref:hypothetical protein n=1 Tax=Streptomyces sp. WMMC897 TaxID=3014782 RepID=UPI0022B5ED75|nr:hypothetical protein [Streptomyces sp. WMMC897]MCZ7413061.1 hypothetical protein [Streptomyces sp. WMMC897]MCZ7413149.1 hypothetical protein [Streptomyces sp. WMMC897]MCZ7415467.1 hypothetical protein [Streptomyces sp. WMMC897]